MIWSDSKYLAGRDLHQQFQLGFVNISAFRVVVLAITIALVVALWALFYRTRSAFRSARSCRIRRWPRPSASFDRIYMLTFALGAVLPSRRVAVWRPQHRAPTMGADMWSRRFWSSWLACTLAGSVSPAARRENCNRSSPTSPTIRSLASSICPDRVFLRVRPQGLFAPSATRR